MSSKRTEIKFIKPCRHEWLNEYELTPAYCLNAAQEGKVVQLNLDNCSIQRMEELDDSATIDDVERVGLLPLVKILGAAPIAMTAIGVNEMPDKWVAGARNAYERFCRKFWPGHKDDMEATERNYDPSSNSKKIQFQGLSEGYRAALGCSYVSLLQIQNIRATFPLLSPVEKFQAHMYSLTHMLDFVSAFELEIAKYAYWNIDYKELTKFPQTVQQRHKDIKDNFSKKQKSINKCREFALNGAMDLHWLTGSKMAEDLEVYIQVDGKRMLIDNWVGTNDHKLFRISQDIHSVYSNGSSLKKLAVTRERELSTHSYWKAVDAFSDYILEYRSKRIKNESLNLLDNIDNAVNHLEKNLERVL